MEQKKDKTLLYVGVAAVILYFLLRKKKEVATGSGGSGGGGGMGGGMPFFPPPPQTIIVQPPPPPPPPPEEHPPVYTYTCPERMLPCANDPTKCYDPAVEYIDGGGSQEMVIANPCQGGTPTMQPQLVNATRTTSFDGNFFEPKSSTWR